MTEERLRAVGKYELLKKEVFQLGTKAGYLLTNLREETDIWLTEKEFNSIDFDKVDVIVTELKSIQDAYRKKSIEMEQLKSTYKI